MSKSKSAKFNFKLKTKLYFISVGMVMLFSAAVLVQFEKGIYEQKESKINGFNLYFENLSSTVSQLFYAKYNNVQAFARNSVLKDPSKKEEARFLLNEFATLFPDIDFIALVDLKGKTITTSNIDASGKKLNSDFLKDYDFSSQTWFKNTSNGKFTEDLKKRIFGAYVSPIHLNKEASKLYGNDRIGMHFATLVEDEYGDPLAVLTAFTNVKWIENEMMDLYKVLAQNGMDSAQIKFLNKKGQPFSILTTSSEGPVLSKDLNKILKLNLFESNHPVIEDLKEGKHGTGVNKDLFGSENDRLFAYGLIKNRRFLDQKNWALSISMLPEDAFSEIIALQNVFYVTLAGAFIFCLVVSTVIVSKLYKQLSDVIEGLRASAGRTFKFVSQLGEMSSKVNEMSSSQASAIQETASTLDEVSQMVKMSAQNANNSVEISAKSESGANHGKNVVSQVVSAMNEIKNSNEDVLASTSEGNKKISEIVTVINEISEKTKVINDIVFQTKLLSFNASVEAARAGEHGKGFAVVAEEVGNLAQMSGKAAQEISSILDESVSRVESIVKENQSSIETIMVKSKSKIDEGINVTGECTSALESIVQDVKVVSNMANEISSATAEQESGVSNISEAMNQLQDITNENSNIAYQTLKCSEQLDLETNFLKSVIETLEREVVGGRVVQSLTTDQSLSSSGASLSSESAISSEEDTFSAQELDELDDEETNVIELIKEKPTERSTSQPMKAVVGSAIPDANDPRFEDV